MILFLLFLSSKAFLIPNNGQGGTISLNSYPDSVCMINKIKQSLLNQCSITCSGTSTVIVSIISSISNSTQLYYCFPKPTLTSSDTTILYSSLPYNLTLTGTNFYNKTGICSLGQTNFTATFINANTTICRYTSIQPGNYTLSLLLNSVNSIGSLSITVLQSFNFGSIGLMNSYVPSIVQINGTRLDSSLYCNFSTYFVKATFVSSFYVTCALPSGLVGNVSV